MKVDFVCERCEGRYPTHEEALACEAKPIEYEADVGDIVTLGAGFGWFDGDKRWVRNPDVYEPQSQPGSKCETGSSNCGAECCTYAFYYVVTARECVKHELRYHLATRAMTEPSGYHAGWVLDVYLVKKPSEYLVRSGRTLRGKSEYYMHS